MTVYCPVCNGGVTYSKRVYNCNFCGHRYRPMDNDPIAYHAEEFRKTFRRSDDEIDADGQVTDTFRANRADIVRKRIARVGHLLRPTDSVLDIGGGAGDFALGIQDRVGHVELTELDPLLLSAARGAGLTAHQHALHDMANGPRFDVVTAWHVVEHLEPLKPALDILKRMFKRYLIIEIPTNRGAPEVFDGHYHFFSDESLQLAFDGLVVRQYGNGVQHPARLAVFVHRRIAGKQYDAAEKSAAQLDSPSTQA